MLSCAPLSKILWVCCWFLRDPCGMFLVGPSRRPGTNWNEQMFYFPKLTLHTLQIFFRMLRKIADGVLKENGPTRHIARKPQELSKKKPPRNNKEAARKLTSTKICIREKQARHRSNQCPRQATITGTVHFTSVFLGRHGGLRNDNCDNDV